MGVHIASNNKTVQQAKRRKKIGGILGGVLAFVLVGGGAALAAMLVESNEATAKVEAGTAQQLKLGNATAVDGKKLFPGMSVDVEFNVENPNPFPVTLTTIKAGGSALKVTCAKPGDEQHLSTDLAISGTTITLATPVVVGAGGDKTVTIAKAVKLAAAASGGCTLEAGFKVSGTGAGSGN